ncbi:MAG TPA: LLM class F420-dependent oxidoreductase [Acidimicrobiales bacterium]|nr:LLM class F420-dependent oxidoreductase [Acidimicrobiales bacterium]
MKFATTFPMVGTPYDPAFGTAQGVMRVARAAEDAGFHGIGFTDHPAPSHRWVQGGGHDAYDPFVAMGFCAAATTRIRLVPNVVVLPYRNPFVVAKAGATLDVLSGGRLTLSVGAGYLKSEFAALGVDHSARNELMDEAIDVLRAVWTQDNVTFEGAHFSARGVTALPRPTRCPPIWIGGNSSGARQRAAERGDGWAPFATTPGVAKTARTAELRTADDLAAAVDDLQRRCDAVGRDRRHLDITFACHAGGNPSSDDFNPDEHIAGLHALEAIGVTWVQVGVPGEDIERTITTYANYGERVIAKVS